MLGVIPIQRYSHYRRPSDTPDEPDYGRMARVVSGMRQVVGGVLK